MSIHCLVIVMYLFILGFVLEIELKIVIILILVESAATSVLLVLGDCTTDDDVVVVDDTTGVSTDSVDMDPNLDTLLSAAPSTDEVVPFDPLGNNSNR